MESLSLYSQRGTYKCILHVTDSMPRRIIIVVPVFLYYCTLSVYDALVLWHNSSAAAQHSLYRKCYMVTEGREELPICSRVFLKNTSSAVLLLIHYFKSFDL